MRLALATTACLAALGLGSVNTVSAGSAWLGHGADAPRSIKAHNAAGIGWGSIEVSASPLGEMDEDGTPVPLRTGKMRYLGGLVLSSPSEYFGGFSGMRLVPEENRLYAVSDRAKWLRADYTLSENGAMAGLSNVELANITFYGDEIIRGARADLEGLELLPDGSAILSFEREARLDYYEMRDDLFKIRSRLLEKDLVKRLPDNESLESVARLADGRLVTVSEGGGSNADDKPGFITDGDVIPGGSGDWAPFTYVAAEEFSPTDMMQDPGGSGDVYVLERAFSRLLGVRARLARFPVSALEPGAVIEPEEIGRLSALHGVDNMEGLALQRMADGRLVAHIISDDNFNMAQRTVLMSWEIEGSANETATAAAPAAQ